MSKAVLMSIQPKWCQLIADGKKTLEIRKTVPREFFREYAKESNGKCGDYFEPFKVYIYCTKADSYFDASHRFGLYSPPHDTPIQGNGKVIGEFVCNRIRPINLSVGWLVDVVDCETSCLTVREILDYAGGVSGKRIYGWHISDLVIYDKPKGLGTFRVPCGEYDKDNPMCGDCRYYHYHYEYPAECICEGMKPITRPPQSWCYVEERNETESQHE